MVTVPAARWQPGHELYRETGDVDLGIPPVVARDHNLVSRLKELNYLQVAGNRFARGLSDIPAGRGASPSRPYIEVVAEVRARAVRWVSDEPQPGWVEVHLDLADGTVAKFFDKPPIFTDRDLRPGDTYPVALTLTCTVAEAAVDTTLVTLVHAEDELGQMIFRVRTQDVLPDD